MIRVRDLFFGYPHDGFALVEQLHGAAAADRIRLTLIERGQPLLRPDPWWRAFVDRFGGIVGRFRRHAFGRCRPIRLHALRIRRRGGCIDRGQGRARQESACKESG